MAPNLAKWGKAWSQKTAGKHRKKYRAKHQEKLIFDRRFMDRNGSDLSRDGQC